MFPVANGSAWINEGNNSGYENSLNSSINVISHVEQFLVPLICILGLTGNSLSLIVFLQKSLRQKSCSLFLAARSFSDNGFLLTLSIVWISSVLDLRLSSIAGICQSMIFLTYVFGCTSVWLVVFVTIENYIRICKPYMVKRTCRKTNAKYALTILLVFVVCGYNFPLWTMDKNCIPDKKHYGFIKIMVYLDSFLTLAFPTLIMSVLMTQIAMTSVTSSKFRRRLSSTSGEKKSPMTKVTTMLLAVTLIFFILNMPSHVVRVRLMIVAFTEDSSNITNSLDLTLQSVSHLMYYLSLSVNVFIYYYYGSTFQNVFCTLFHAKKTKKRNNKVKKEYVYPSILVRRKNGKMSQKVPPKDSSNSSVDPTKFVHLHGMHMSVI